MLSSYLASYPVLPPVPIENTKNVLVIGNLNKAVMDSAAISISDSKAVTIKDNDAVVDIALTKDLFINNKEVYPISNYRSNVNEATVLYAAENIVCPTNNITIDLHSVLILSIIQKLKFRIDSIRKLLYYGDFVTFVFVYKNKVIDNFCNVSNDNTAIKIYTIPIYIPKQE